MLNRRRLLITAPAVLAVTCTQDLQVDQLQVSRDDECTCCSAWAAAMEKTRRFRVALFDTGDLPSFKRSMGVPAGLAGCHTAKAEGYVIEGRVPAADILRLLEEEPKGVLGLAVAGMPRGAAGMEQADGTKDAFTVYAFQAGGVKREYASYPASA